MDKDSRSYKYVISISLDGKEYTNLFNGTNQYRRSWQNLYFQSRPVRFFQLIGIGAINIMNTRTFMDAVWGAGFVRKLYDSFDIVGLQAMYKTTNLPELIDGIIKPTKNVAKVEYGACVEKGIGDNKMLNENTNEYTCHEIGSHIELRFNQPYYISSLRMLLGNNMDPLKKYSFCIETSMTENDWEMAVDKQSEYLSGWQEFDFEPRPAICIKITGTQKDVVSIVYF